ncbi:Crp/Fnr family transcriptional regulator [Rhodobacter xanthinilyticus]|uniref:Crp/Fnr family transcriptional regulator n=1 Tax=Rhodobacter xanthinilyticus TaxID=1850250 RepID=A0A1D9MD20_9RHOB|nr:Crp/Fnr family transcriptional regulator [Rhodobacter xanthinilyticus]AOZ69703.1 Crp/Fnr family transcriptional regulator [Rhodobacter xanthinilyticus]
MSDWTQLSPALTGLDDAARAALGALVPMDLPRGAVLFRPGEPVAGFAIVLEGRIEVFLTGANGRELLLYAVEPGQSCVQTTLGLLGGGDYAGEAVTTRPTRIVLVPRGLFLELIDRAPSFRQMVFAAFAERMNGMIALMERVSFQSVEARLAGWLCARAEAGRVAATHAEIAAQIGSAREVVSRRLDAFARRGWVATERGAVQILDPRALERLALCEAG